MTAQQQPQEWPEIPPFQILVGVEPVEAKDGASVVRLPWKPELGNRKGDVQGGAIATLMDVTLSRAIRSMVPDSKGLSTITLNVSYLEPARGTLLARGKVLKVGGTIALAEAGVVDAEGKLVAHATGSFRIIAKR